jgi:hypothetical protein
MALEHGLLARCALLSILCEDSWMESMRLTLVGKPLDLDEMNQGLMQLCRSTDSVSNADTLQSSLTTYQVVQRNIAHYLKHQSFHPDDQGGLVMQRATTRYAAVVAALQQHFPQYFAGTCAPTVVVHIPHAFYQVISQVALHNVQQQQQQQQQQNQQQAMQSQMCIQMEQMCRV